MAIQNGNKTNGSHLVEVAKFTDRAWWKEATVYQVYPASFCDHADSGHGTLRGIQSRIPYLKELGVDIVWLSPIYKSPQADMGYDISDYQDIDPRYGTLTDWDELRDTIHNHGMKLVMDLVVNHSSDQASPLVTNLSLRSLTAQHAWFKASKSSKTDPKRDWYIWRPPRYDGNGERKPPNNWKSTFGSGSAWEWDEATGEYYLHTFLKEQPDLNWENPELRNEVFKMMRWWLEKGADGFRMDVINFIAKAPGLPDAPVTSPGREYQHFGRLSINRPEVHGYLKEMHEAVLKDYDCFCVGETPGDENVAAYAPYSVPANKELQMIFHFHHQNFDRKRGGLGPVWNEDWKVSDMKRIFNEWQVQIEQAGGWNSNYLENHDQPRIVSRMTSDHPDDRTKAAKLMAMFHCSLTGTIFVYQGQEMGIINVPRDWPESEYIDIETIQNIAGEREYRRRTTGEKDPDMTDVLVGMRMSARDNGRTPVQWDDGPNAGFSKGKPWMRIHDDYPQWNIARQLKDSTSPWKFWQKMLRLRKEYPALVYGSFGPLDESNEEVYAYTRHDVTISQKLFIVLNLARKAEGRGRAVSWSPKTFGIDLQGAKLLITNREGDLGHDVDTIELEPWEGRVYLLKAQ